jgi:hypothetical protein
VIDKRASLESVIRHATDLEDDYDDIEPTLTALAGSGDRSLVPLLEAALDRFLDGDNFYGRDLVAGVLAGIEGPAALPTLLRASARDLGDDQDSLRSEIIELLEGPRRARASDRRSRPADQVCGGRVGADAGGLRGAAGRGSELLPVSSVTLSLVHR